MDLGAAIGAFFSSPLKFISDPANTTLEYQTTQAKTQGVTDPQMETILKANDYQPGSPIQDAVNGLIGGISGIFKALPWIVLAVIVVLAVYFLYPLRRAA
jgi:hypothetical protein